MSLPEKRFRVINEGFTCEHCKQQVLRSEKGTPRDHCPHCLYSKHVDVNPGDRQNSCQGLLEPIGVVHETKRGYVIHYRCSRCGSTVVNRSNNEDDFGLLVTLSSRPI